MSINEIAKEIVKTKIEDGDIGAKIREQMAALEKRIAWVTCPWCGEEWVRLYHGICIDCNRDPRGFLQAQKRMPIDNMQVKIELKSWAWSIPREFRELMPGCFRAVLVIGMRKFFADCDINRDMPIQLTSEIESENMAKTDNPGGSSDKLKNYHVSVFEAWKSLRLFLHQ